MRPGQEVAAPVNGFYERNGGRACVRPDDLFFLATIEDRLVGCVRYCVENETPMLRTMMVDHNWRRRRVGSNLLQAFAQYLDTHQIHDVYCLPYAHLEAFYGSADFVRIETEATPLFLRERILAYDPTGTQYFCMWRP